MKCDKCKNENTWLEMIGKELVCHKCLSKHRLMGNILRTHANTFKFLLKKLNLQGFEGYMGITDEQIQKLVNINQLKIKYKPKEDRYSIL